MNVEYGSEKLYGYFNTEHPFKKIIRIVNGVYFEIKPRGGHVLDIYIRNNNDKYNIFAGYGVDTKWELYYKVYHYPKQIVRKLKKFKRTSINYGEKNELCPHCDHEVSIKTDELVFKCPNCSKWVLLCSMCDRHYNCNDCELEKIVNKLNKD